MSTSPRPAPADAIAKAQKAEDAKDAAADAALASGTSISEAVAGAATAPPPLPSGAQAENSQSKQSGDIDFEVQNTGLRVLRVIKLPELDTTEVVLYAKEWGVAIGFRMIATVRRIVDKLVEKGVLKRDKETLVDTATGEAIETPWTDKLDGLLAVIEESQEDVMGAVMASMYTEAVCAKGDAIEDSFLDEVGIGDFVTMLRAIWHVNMESGSLKNALGALTL